MPLDDFMQGLQQLNKGLQQFSISNAIQDANEKIRQVRSSQIDDAQKMSQVRSIADEMANNLYSVGAGPAEVKAIFEQQTGQSSKPIQTFEQGAAEAIARGDKKAAEQFYQYHQKDQEFKAKIAAEANKTKIEVAGIGANSKLGPAQTKQLESFRKTYAKAELEGLDQLAAAPPENAKGNLEYVMKLKQLIKRTDPRISDQDFKLAAPNVSLANKAARAWSQLVNNEPLKEDDAAVNVLIDVLKKKTIERAKTKAQGFSKSRANIMQMKPEDVYGHLVQDNPDLADESGSAPAPASAPAGGNGLIPGMTKIQ